MGTRELEIVIEHDGPTVPFDSFVAIARHTVWLLRTIDKTLTGEPTETAKWAISRISMASPLHMALTAVPARGNVVPRDCITPFIEDWNRLDRGEPPALFTPAMQRKAQELVGRYRAGGVRSVHFRSGSIEASPTQRVAAYVTELYDVYTEVGSIEGKLDVIDVHGHEEVKVWDDRYGRAVSCHVTALQIEKAKELLGKRVSVQGCIRCERRRPVEVVDVFEIAGLGVVSASCP